MKGKIIVIDIAAVIKDPRAQAHGEEPGPSAGHGLQAHPAGCQRTHPAQPSAQLLREIKAAAGSGRETLKRTNDTLVSFISI